MQIDFDQMRQSAAVHYNELARVMNSHQERCYDGSSRVEIDTQEAQRLLHELRTDLQKLMFLQCEELEIAPLPIKLDRVHNNVVNRFELVRA